MKKIIVALSMLAPSVAFADITDANGVVREFTSLANTTIGILVAFAVLWIIVNAVRFIFNGDNPEERTKFGQAIGWGIVGLFIIGAIWGLVAILSNTFKTSNTPPSAVPTVTTIPQVQAPN